MRCCYGLFQTVVDADQHRVPVSPISRSWPTALPVLLMLMTFVGGCAGSTSGGIKVLRWVLVGKQASREIKRLVHPSGEFAVKLRGKPVPPRVIDAVWGYFTIYHRAVRAADAAADADRRRPGHGLVRRSRRA